MADKLEKARVTTVNIGSISIEGLMFPDGSFGIGFPQVYKLFNVPQKMDRGHLKPHWVRS